MNKHDDNGILLLHEDGRRTGPHTHAEVVDKIMSGELTRDTKGLKKDGTGWTPLNAVLFPAAQSPLLSPDSPAKVEQTAGEGLNINKSIPFILVAVSLGILLFFISSSDSLSGLKGVMFSLVTLSTASYIGSNHGIGAACIALGGMIAGYFGLFYDTSVTTAAGAVNNLGLMNDRLIGVVVGMGLAILGAVLHLRKK